MTNAELAILSLLAEHPRHGYEIEQVIEERGMREWTEVGFSSIYYVLKKLQARHLVEGRVAAGVAKGPARTIYHVTEAGHTALREATYAALARPEPQPSPFLLGLANLPVLSPEEALQALMEHQKGMSRQRERIAHRREREQGAPDFVYAMFDRTLALIDAEMAWLEQFLSRYARKEEAAMLPTLEEKKLYTAPRHPEVVEIPEGWFLTVTGEGDPDGEACQAAIGALYAVAYTLKFKLKPRGQDFKVGVMEGQWWSADPVNWDSTPRDRWQWKLMIRMP
ncbi:MAG TPA: helix-turn-helix transcriptional regulator, partial [Symbiobacteriaceae bacterium]|nr:helix-turn-helix transcriptional regulator [Symbiobacteriaceae bacterium]